MPCNICETIPHIIRVGGQIDLTVGEAKSRLNKLQTPSANSCANRSLFTNRGGILLSNYLKYTLTKPAYLLPQRLTIIFAKPLHGIYLG